MPVFLPAGTQPGWETRLVHGLIDHYLAVGGDHDDTLAAILDLIDTDLAIQFLAAHPSPVAGEVLWTLVSFIDEEEDPDGWGYP